MIVARSACSHAGPAGRVLDGRARLRAAPGGAAVPPGRRGPAIDHNYLSDPADLEALCDGVELVGQLVSTPPLSAVLRPLPDGTIDWRTRDVLRAQIRATIGTTYHPSSTCRMGPDTDPMAVVDHEARVHRVRNLRVADASIFPYIPRCNLHFPIVAAAEKIADAIRHAGREPGQSVAAGSRALGRS